MMNNDKKGTEQVHLERLIETVIMKSKQKGRIDNEK